MWVWSTFWDGEKRVGRAIAKARRAREGVAAYGGDALRDVPIERRRHYVGCQAQPQHRHSHLQQPLRRIH